MRTDEIVTKLLQRYWRLTRSLTLGVQGALIDNEGRFLLVRHTYRPGWHFPGGGVEKHETTVSALSRELREEAAVLFEDEPTLFGLYANFLAFPNDHVALFVLRQWRQTHVPQPNAEIAEVGRYAPDQLPADTARATRQRIAEILGHVPRSPHW